MPPSAVVGVVALVPVEPASEEGVSLDEDSVASLVAGAELLGASSL